LALNQIHYVIESFCRRHHQHHSGCMFHRFQLQLRRRLDALERGAGSRQLRKASSFDREVSGHGSNRLRARKHRRSRPWGAAWPATRRRLWGASIGEGFGRQSGWPRRTRHRSGLPST